MGFWDFWDRHEFLSWWAMLLFAVVAELAWKLCNRLLRTIKVFVRGWPPDHLDADGDWKPEQKREESHDVDPPCK